MSGELRRVSKRKIGEKAKALDQEMLPGIKQLIVDVGENFGISRIDFRDGQESLFWKDEPALIRWMIGERYVERSAK